MHSITSTWPELLGQFFSAFTKPGAKIFSNLIAGWVLCTARRTITGILPFADPMNSRVRDAYHRFFPDARWAMSRLWQKLTLTLIALVPKARNWPSSKRWLPIFHCTTVVSAKVGSQFRGCLALPASRALAGQN